MDNDTIAALSTPIGRGGIGIIRISGPDALTILRSSFRPLPQSIAPRTLYHGRFMVNETAWDEGLAVWFSSPHSYTGEDVCEISLHANPHLLEQVIMQIISAGARHALPGEFTYRAYIHGKLDLLQAEAINEMIAANSSVFAHIEFENLQGKLSRTVHEIKKALTELAVAIETAIEFQEDHLLETAKPEIKLGPLTELLQTILENQRFHDALKRNPRVAIVGGVNAGKSTLFNALLQEDRALVSHHPGTTRDFLYASLHIGDIAVDIIDMAGFRASPENDIETEAIDRSRLQLNECDAAFLVIDASAPPDSMDEEILTAIASKPHRVLLNKIDSADPLVLPLHKNRFANEPLLLISALNALRLDEVRHCLRDWVYNLRPRPDSVALNFRQRTLFSGIHQRIQLISRWHRDQTIPIDLTAEEIRQALIDIGHLTGEITSDNILTEIFNKFCIGK